MLIRFVGPRTRRRLWPGGYEFGGRTGFVQEVVEAETVAAMLTEPGDEFEVDPGEPLLEIKGIGPARAGEMALAGVGSAAELAALTPAGVVELAREMGASEEMVAGWVETAVTVEGVGRRPRPTDESEEGVGRRPRPTGDGDAVKEANRE